MAIVLGVWYVRTSRAQNIALANMQMQEGRYAEALKSLRSAKTPYEHLLKSLLYVKIGYSRQDKKDAFSDIFLGGMAAPDIGSYASLKAAECYDLAIAAAGRAQMLEKNNPDAYSLLALVSAFKDDFDTAKGHAAKAIQFADTNYRKSNCHLVLALVFARKSIVGGRDYLTVNHLSDQAIAHIKNAIGLNPQNDLAYELWGIIKLTKGNWPEALAYFEEARRLYQVNLTEFRKFNLMKNRETFDFDIAGHISIKKNDELIAYADRQGQLEAQSAPKK